MDDILLLDATERYLKGEMTSEEKALFEQLRQNTPEIDQMVVEHNMLLHQIDAYAGNRDFRHTLHETHNKLLELGDINHGTISTKGKVIQLWNKYRRVTGIAATIAGVTAVLISTLVSYVTPGNKNDLLMLSRKVAQIQRTQHVQSNQINAIKTKVPIDETASNGGTSFLIDSKGYLITNAHVVAGSSTILVQSNKGQEFKAKIAYIDNEKDLAILKIEDDDYMQVSILPYSIRRAATDLGEPIFTLGYPREEIVYNQGYMSAKTGFNGDTMSCQIAVSANPGNSGGPVFNKNGEVIGILSTAQTKAEGVVFAIKAKNIFQAIDEMKKEDTNYYRIKAPTVSNVKGMDRVQQVKQIEDCVFMVKSFTR
jgi:serine protease Do